MVSTRGKLVRAGIAVGVAAAMVAVAFAVPWLLGPDPTPVDPPSTPAEFDPATLAPTTIPAEGSIGLDADGTGMTVLVDYAHGNRLDRGEMTPLETAIIRSGATLRSLYPGEPLDFALSDADALVIADPREPYTATELAALDAFVDRGGRILIAAEPNQRTLAASVEGPSLATQRSRVTELGSEFGIAFGTGYLYHLDPAATDGNFKNVIVGATAEGPFEGIERGVVYTAAPVWTSEGERLLVARDGTQLSSGGAETYGVAVTARGGDVIAVGDTSFLDPANHLVGDNEVIVERLVAFLLDE